MEVGVGIGTGDWGRATLADVASRAWQGIGFGLWLEWEFHTREGGRTSPRGWWGLDL